MIKPTVLIIMDGWGLAPAGPGNAISAAQLNFIPKFWNSYPHTELAASGGSVGLPSGEDGNTETGHINIGAGRIIYQDLQRINMSIADRTFFKNEAFRSAIKYAKDHKSNLHIMGLLSDAGVHSKMEHLFAILDLIRHEDNKIQIFLHLFTDGRDSPPQSAKRFIDVVEKKLSDVKTAKIATIMGRYWAMDRDQRWERTQKAYEALTGTTEYTAPNANAAIDAAYARGKTDEFIDPTIILNESGYPLPRIVDNDAAIFFNFRIDRPRQLTRAFTLPNFETYQKPASFDPYMVKYFHKHIIEHDQRVKPFTRGIFLPELFFVTMTEYEQGLPCAVAFPPQKVSEPLGEIISRKGLKQLRMAETEKERFVTYYFNGLREEPFAGEDRIIVPSPAVRTYDLQPEMAALDITDKVIERIGKDVYSFIVINFANPDMVAHTGNIHASVLACQTVDACVGKIVGEVLTHDGACVVTADHGNVEEMLGHNGEMDTEHSIFPVPFMVIKKSFEGYPQELAKGILADIAPTILALMGLAAPSVMTGKNLLADFSH